MTEGQLGLGTGFEHALHVDKNAVVGLGATANKLAHSGGVKISPFLSYKGGCCKKTPEAR